MAADRVERGAGAGVAATSRLRADVAAGWSLGWTAGAITVRRSCGAGRAAAGWSAERVTVPFRLKFSSPFGPTESLGGGAVAAGVLVVAGVSCASAAAGRRASALAANSHLQRETALIRSRSTH